MASITYEQVPIRLELDIISNPPAELVDINTGLAPAFWRAQNIAVQMAVFDPTLQAVNLGNLQYIQLVLMNDQDSVYPLVTKTVLAASIIPTIDRDDWLNGSAQQVVFNLTAAEADQSLSAQQSQSFWMVVQAKTTNGANIVYGAGWITIYNPGTSLPAPDTGITRSFHEQDSAGGAVTVNPTSQNHFEFIDVSGSPETRDVVIRTAGLGSGAEVTLRFALPSTSGIIFRVWDSSISGSPLSSISTQSDGSVPTALLKYIFDGADLRRLFYAFPSTDAV